MGYELVAGYEVVYGFVVEHGFFVFGVVFMVAASCSLWHGITEKIIWPGVLFVTWNK